MIESKISLFLLEIGGLLDSSSVRDLEMSLREEVRDAVTSIVEDGISSVEALGVEDASANLSVLDLGGYPQLVSDTGSFDFSRPSRKMLDSLLKNAKISKDGHKYKVIPVGKSGNKPLVGKDLDGGLSAMRSVSPMGNITAEMVSAFVSGATPTSRTTFNEDRSVTFRTASEKQDANSQWVYPGKEANIEFEVVAINARIINRIDEAVQDIIARTREKAYVLRDE